MTSPPLDPHDPAFPIMTMDILNNVLSRADNPGELGQYLTGEIRELTGARCVVLIQCLHAQSTAGHRVVSIHPPRKADWASSPAMIDFYNTVHHLTASHTWRGNDGDGTAAFLRSQGFELSLAIPLNIGNSRVGAMLVFGPVDQGHLDAVLGVLDTLATIVALVLRNSLLYEKQEQTIQERTQELQISNNALRQSQNRLNLALDCSGVGTWDWDAASDTHTGDQYAGILFGRGANAFTGKTSDVLTFIHPDDRAHVKDALGRAIRDVTGYESEYRVVWPDGSVHYLAARGKAYSDPSSNTMRISGVCWDITKRKQAEEAERQARSAAEEASRAKDQFIAVLSHELRTPLTPVLVEVELLQTRRDLPAEVIASLEMIRRNVELESQLIVDLLDITQVVRGELRLEPAPVDAHETLRDALAICQPQIIARGHQVDLDLQAGSHILFADPVRLRQIFWNLLGNAVKYTPDRGRICLRSRNTPEGRLEVHVIDNGVGIAPDLLHRLFDPFVQGEQTLSRRFGGLGLGLSIAKALAQAHGGTLRVDSPGQGEGATFTAEFPVLAGELQPTATPPPPIDAPSRPARILLVEDNEDTLRILAKLLRLSRHEVRTATTVKTAAQLAAQWDFDLLLCDIGLPDGTGWDLMRQLSQVHPVKALALSGFATADDIQKSKEAGFLDHLAKPIKIDRLRNAIATALA